MKKSLGFILSMMVFAVSAAPGAGSLTITVTGLRSNNGSVNASLFTNAKYFPGDVRGIIKTALASISQGRAVLVIKDIPFGRYAVSVMHDENNNGKLDTNFMGIPSEGIGASRNAKGKFGPPKFEDAAFDLAVTSMPLDITMTYL